MFCFRPAIPSVICMRCKRITKATFVCGETCSANFPDRVTLGIVAIGLRHTFCMRGCKTRRDCHIASLGVKCAGNNASKSQCRSVALLEYSGFF